MTPTIGKDLPTTLRLFGRGRASALVRFADAAVEYTEDFIEKNQIDCHYNASGNVIAGVHAKQARYEHGTVTANDAVIATNAYTEHLGRRKGHVVPLRVSLFETEPLSKTDLDEISWKGREGIYTAHEALENYRLTAHGTLTGGSKVVRYRYGSQLPPGRDPEAFSTIERMFRERFPTLTHLPIATFWGGWIGFTFDLLPQLGVEGAQRRRGHCVPGLRFDGR